MRGLTTLQYTRWPTPPRLAEEHMRIQSMSSGRVLVSLQNIQAVTDILPSSFPTGVVRGRSTVWCSERCKERDATHEVATGMFWMTSRALMVSLMPLLSVVRVAPKTALVLCESEIHEKGLCSDQWGRRGVFVYQRVHESIPGADMSSVNLHPSRISETSSCRRRTTPTLQKHHT